MILSAQFWPTFRDEKITVPSNMEKSLEEFTKKYEALKGNRTLAWKNHLGNVFYIWIMDNDISNSLSLIESINDDPIRYSRICSHFV